MSNERALEAQMSADALYREDVFTDQRVGTVRRLTPVRSDGGDEGALQRWQGRDRHPERPSADLLALDVLGTGHAPDPLRLSDTRP